MERILSPAGAGFSDVDYQKDTFSFLIHNFRLYLTNNPSSSESRREVAKQKSAESTAHEFMLDIPLRPQRLCVEKTQLNHLTL